MNRSVSIQYHVNWLVLVSIVLLASLLFRVNDADAMEVPVANWELPAICAMRRFTSFPCPGCGLSRAFVSLVRGDMATAWKYNPASIVWFVAMLLQYPYRLAQIWRLRNDRDEIIVRRGIWIWAVLVVSLFIPWLYRLANGFQ